MMAVRLLLIVGLGVMAYWSTDVYSESLLRSVLLPIVSALSLVALIVWLVSLLRSVGIRMRSRSHYLGDGGFDMPDGGGGDGG